KEQVLAHELAQALLGAERVEPLAALAQGFDLLLGDPRRRPTRRVALEQRAKLVEVVQVFGVVNSDHRAPVGRGDDEALGLQHQEGFAHGRPADPELARELLFLEPASGLEPAVQNRLADQLCGGDARVADERLAFLEYPRHGGKHTVCNRARQRPSLTIVDTWTATRSPVRSDVARPRKRSSSSATGRSASR